MRIETERLILREITNDDFQELSKMLKDIDVMYAWEHSFKDEEIVSWINRRLNGYATYGYDYLLAIDKKNNAIVGQIGLIEENIEETSITGLGWILNKAFWKQGYATEGAKALIDYAFNTLKKDNLIAKIRTNNEASIKVSQNLKMIKTREILVTYKGKVMPHSIYSLQKNN